MSSRKRRICHNITSQEIPSKRARLLSTIWNTNEEERGDGDITVDTTRSRSSTRRSRRKVKAIIGENLKEYLVDWEDLNNNQKSKPSWRPKESIDESAIADWIDFLARQYRTNRFSRKRRRKSSVGQETDGTATVRPTRSTRNQPQRLDSTPSSGFTESERDRRQISIIPSVILPPPDNLPKFTVEVSQHSSLDRDQYVRYPSSLSTQRLHSSVISHQDSGLGDSSPPPESSRPTQVCQHRIVPDSQSLPGSSSYVLRSSDFVSTTDPSSSAQDHPIVGTVQSITASETQSSSLRGSELVESIEVSTSLVGTSQARTNISKQSALINQISSTVSSGVSFGSASLSHISCSISSSNPTAATDLAHISTQEYLNVVSTSSLDISASGAEASDPSEVSNINSPEHNSRSCVGVPLRLESQTSDKSLSADNWQSGQLVPNVTESVSQISSESTGKPSNSSAPAKKTYRAVSQETVARRRSAVPEAFTISEDYVNDTQTSQTTEESVLSQRDPNSQPTKHPQLEQIQEEEIQLLNDSTYLETEISSNLRTHPNSLQRNRPHETPASFLALVSDYKMSDQNPSHASSPSEGPQRTLSSGPPIKSLREKLLSLQAAGRVSVPIDEIKIVREDLPRVLASPPLISPKTVPPISKEPSGIDIQPMRVPVEIPLPVRAVQSQPHTPAFPSRLAMTHSFSQPDVSLNPINLGESEYAIPLPMNTRVRDQYVSTINYYRRTIEDCMKAEEPDSQLKSGIDNLLFRVNAVATHVDLDCKAIFTNGRYTLGENEESPADEAKWAENCSAKFQFLGFLIEETRDADMLIAIVATSDHLLDIIETFLKGKEVVYTRPDAKPRPGPIISHPGGFAARGRLVVTLLSSTDDVPYFSKKRPNLVIAFDRHFNVKSPKVMSLRESRDGRNNGDQLVPVIHLLVYGSGEHIEQCLPKDLDPWSRTRQIASYITQTRHRVGQLQPDEFGPKALAEEIAEFVRAGGLEKDWALPGIRAIDDLESNDIHSFESSAFDTTQTTDQSNSENIMGRASATPKRAIETDARTSVSKKQKSTLADVTHVSDSMQDTQSTETNKDEVITKLRWQLREALLDLDAEKLSYKSCQAGMNIFHREIEDKLAAEKKAHEKTEKERQEIVSSLNDLQTRVEDKTKQSRKLWHEKDELETTMAVVLNKSALHTSEIAMLKTHQARLEDELKSAREANKVSTNPDVAELESLKEEIRKLKAENVAQQKKATTHATDLEYTRIQYQNASNAAVEATTRASKLEQDLAAMTVKAQGEAARLAEVNKNTAVEQAHNEVEKLQLELQMFESMLRRKEEELRELKRGRGGVVTRGSSVGGKSPRGGSRAGSPAPGAGGFGGKVGGSALRFG